MRIVAVIQARLGSSRLPGKTMLSICGKPLLIQMVERVSYSKKINEIVVATTNNTEDNIIYELCKKTNIKVYRGDENDLLARHYFAGRVYGADAIVKIPSDCPLIDASIIDKVIEHFVNSYPNYDFVSNLHPPTYPDGNDVEIMKMSVLEEAWQNATKDYEREHTTPYIWDNPSKYKIGNVVWDTGYNYSNSHRWTIDYEEDYAFIRKVYSELYPKKQNFTLYDILTLLHANPYIAEINSKYLGKYWYDNNINQLKNIEFYRNKVRKNVS